MFAISQLAIRIISVFHLRLLVQPNLGITASLKSFALAVLWIQLSSLAHPTLAQDSSSTKSGNFTANSEINEAFFENRIRPILIETCFPCHNQIKPSGGLMASTLSDFLTGGDSGPAIQPGDANASLLIKAIRREPDVSPMPPEKSQALRQDQIADMIAWIDAGALWPAHTETFTVTNHWAFEPLQQADPPKPINADWARNEIDLFIRSEQETKGLIPAKEADRNILFRRAHFDLTGLPPTPKGRDEFLQDSSADAWEQLIDRLLDSPNYGERWARHWLDVVRYADTAGETADYPVPNAWKYRDYVINAFQNDKPYDQFVREQIAGDVIALEDSSSDYAECVAATGFLAISRRFGFDSENYHHLTIQDTLDTLGQSFLGLSIGCARCHDHKFDAITIEDYYRLYGIFASSRYSFPGSEQKPRIRTLSPQIPPTQANAQWRSFRQRIAHLTRELQLRDVPVPNAVLGSLSDCDGDFELQAPAAGGSKGVLVPPWISGGPVEVSGAAQSPFQNLFPGGKHGARIPTNHKAYYIEQALYPTRTSIAFPRLFWNLDFRIDTSDEMTQSSHQILLGSSSDGEVCQIEITRDAIVVKADSDSLQQFPIEPQQWYNLSVVLDFELRSIVPVLTTASQVHHLPTINLATSREYSIERVRIQSSVRDASNYPGIAFDNFSLEEIEIPLPSTKSSTTKDEHPSLQQLKQDLAQLVGIEGDFENQHTDHPPVHPWNAGPNSVVKISDQSQSPYRNLFPTGTRGVLMPNRQEYDGFGCSFPNILTHAPQTWNVSFDFCCSSDDAGGDGSWRYYLGHGPGHSAALELFFNARYFFVRDGDDIREIAPVQIGKWYQVQITLDFEKRTCNGSILSTESQHAFTSVIPPSWDGIIDYTFIDSYGHQSGVRPELKADNFFLGSAALVPLDQANELPLEHLVDVNRIRVDDLKDRIRKMEQEGAEYLQELTELLINGPFPMAYGVTEGTPMDVAIQIRGEPDLPGPVVRRGFISVLNGAQDLATTTGSGRQQLAEWLTQHNAHLLARVMVNRIWQYHFGQGLVKTPNDFGVRGEKPTHPELLDYLAKRFIDSGWSVKSMHRYIMNSATYRQQAVLHPAMLRVASQRDLSNDYVSFSRRRMSAEEIRDSLLSVADLLQPIQPAIGHPFPEPTTWGFSQHAPFAAVYEHDHRSIYLMVQRIKRHPFLALFDGADPNASTAIRLGSVVPTQALFFLNDPLVHRCADTWSHRLLEENTQLEACVQQAVWQIHGRETSQKELDRANQFMERYLEFAPPEYRSEQVALAAYLRSLFASNEFIYVE